MDELLFLLFNGPKLESIAEPEKVKKTYSKLPSKQMIEKYRNWSEGGKIWSLLVVKHNPITIHSAAKNLREIYKMGYLKPVGRLKGTRSNSPPYIYEWVQ